jgi:hypothetical protein
MIIIKSVFLKISPRSQIISQVILILIRYMKYIFNESRFKLF